MRSDTPEVGNRDGARSGARGETGARPAGTLGAAVTAVALFVFVLWMVLTSLGFGPEARRLPLVVGGPLTALAVVNLVVELRALVRRRRGFPTPDDEVGSTPSVVVPPDAHEVGSHEEATSDQALSLLGTLSYLAVLVVLALLLGVVIGGAIFIIGAMRLLGRHAWWSSVLTALVLSLGMNVLSRFFGAPLYAGLWEPLSLLTR